MSYKLKNLSFREISEQLQITIATLKNWERQGIFTSRNGLVSQAELLRLKKDLEEGRLNRLNSRANRTRSSRNYWPDELFRSLSSRRVLDDLLRSFQEEGLSIELCMIFTAVKLFRKSHGKDFHPLKKAPSSVSCVFKEYADIRGVQLSSDIPLWLEQFTLPEEPELLGLLYQRLRTEGERSIQGAFFTPEKLALELVSPPENDSALFLDPSCGNGIFLSAALKRGWKISQLRGMDLDAGSVFITRCRLILESGEDCLPRILSGDFLDYPFAETFDTIVTNPPWGNVYRGAGKKKLQILFPEIKTGEAASYFITRGLQLLGESGVLTYLLPESLLTVRSHRDIRELILEKSIPFLCRSHGRCFKRVFSSVVSLSIRKSEVSFLSSESIETVVKDRSYRIPLARILQDSHFRIRLGTEEKDWIILDKIQKKADLRLENVVRNWGMGIVTGNNSRFCLDISRSGNNPPGDGYEPLIKGKDIEPFSIKDRSMYIKFSRKELQQSAREELYRVKGKVVYRFISRYPVVALDTHGDFLLNSANFFIPDENLYNPRILTLLLNSKLYRYLYLMMYPGVKVLRRDLEKIPLPSLNESEVEAFLKHYGDVITDPLNPGVQRSIYSFFALSDEDIERVEMVIQRER